MSKHIEIVKDTLSTGNQISRDMFLHERDVRNLATKVARETYMLHTFDAKSVQMWVEQNTSSVFFYQETALVTQGALTHATMPFIVGIQTPWQREMMVKFGHEGGVSIDATFGTNENKVSHETLSSRNQVVITSLPFLRSMLYCILKKRNFILDSMA